MGERQTGVQVNNGVPQTGELISKQWGPKTNIQVRK